MIISDANVPLMMASLAFVVICLLFAGILIHFRRLSHRREMIQKIRAELNDWSATETDTSSLKLDKKSTNAFVNFLNVIGLKTNPGKSTDNSQTRIKFLRAGLRGRNGSAIFWGQNFSWS